MMVQIVKTLLTLLSVIGVTELGFQTTYGKSSLDVSQTVWHRTMCYFERSCQTHINEKEVDHQKLWGYQDENLDEGLHERFNDDMKKKMLDHKTCHMNCGNDRACHQQCPKPWKSFQEKCERAQSITDCHKSCHENHGSFECHSKCPLPECPKMAQKMQDAMQCHSKCKRGEYGCHHACPKPMKKMVGMCQELKEVVSCHEVCESGDFKCHHECPHVQGIWKFHGQRIGDHKHDLHQTQISEDEVDHQKLWGYQDENLDGGRRERFNDDMKKKMMDHKTCHMKCGKDWACHQQCPKPWKSFQEKCERAQSITDCHKSCHENHGSFECHSKCPLPECPNMAQKMQDSMQCHSKCKRGEYGCHHACPKPMKKMMGMCQELKEVVSCHEVCEPGDFRCHHECPHMQGIWYFHGQRTDVHEQDHHHMQQDEIVACRNRCAGEQRCLASCPYLQGQKLNGMKRDQRTRAALNIPLVSFEPDAAPSLTHKWYALNDPVMGGQSYSNVSISNGILKFTGKCAIVPFLGAPGFITAATGRGFGPGGVDPERFVDVSSCKGLTIVAKDYSNGYSGYRISFGNGHVPGTHHAYGFKADLHPTVGSFGAVSIPFTNFTDFWDDATGKPIRSCKENREYCPDTRTLTNMQTMSIWAEGVVGHVHLEVKSIAGYSCTAMMKQEPSNSTKDVFNILLV